MFHFHKNIYIKLAVTIILLIVSAFFINEIIGLTVEQYKPLFIFFAVVTAYFIASIITDFSIWLSKNHQEGS